jgi:hypothetical protein
MDRIRSECFHSIYEKNSINKNITNRQNDEECCQKICVESTKLLRIIVDPWFKSQNHDVGRGILALMAFFPECVQGSIH